MGYDVHIARTEDWTESESRPIPLDEWFAYISADPEMRHDGQAVVSLRDGYEMRYESQGLAVWTAYSQPRAADDLVWFAYGDGCIVVKNPDHEILGKMLRIAAALNAFVVGDDGELYDERSLARLQEASKAPAAWWRRLLSRRA
ncbi:MAG TPA: hypothetical protein VGN57_16080 [Pirellulaceae bacterium]|nr:hypothetical protein [Pirellulaceae bacterium]